MSDKTNAELELEAAANDILAKAAQFTPEQLKDTDYVQKNLEGLIATMREKSATVRDRNQMLEDRAKALKAKQVQGIDLNINLERDE